MGFQDKYGRTYHFDFSPGTTSDDRINREWREQVQKFPKILHTEKLDGENTCLSQYGVFARSHAAPTLHSWADHLKVKQSMIQHDLKSMDFEIFGENLYALHSIIYPELTHHFYVFGIRVLDKWLSWEETKQWANFFDFEVVPELGIQDTTEPELIKTRVLELASEPSIFGSVQNNTDPLRPCTCEGLVSRNLDEYGVDDFKEHVFKYVRKDHVQTDVHWSKTITRARLKHEY
jgi:hypothetical protein